MQWDAADFESIGFSYKPVTPDVKKVIEDLQLNPSLQNDESVIETI